MTDEQQIRRLMDDWRRLTAEGNGDGLLSLTTEDVVFLTPGNPPFGREDFAAGFREVSAKARIESTQDVKDIRASGDVAYAWSHLSITAIPHDGDDPWESSGHVLSVFHRSPAGGWLLAREGEPPARRGRPGPGLAAGLLPH